MDNEIKVDVLQEDIDCAVKLEPHQCAVAKALQRMGYENVSVIPSAVKFYEAPPELRTAGTEVHMYKLPLEATNFISIFDGFKDGDIAPISFTMKYDTTYKINDAG